MDLGTEVAWVLITPVEEMRVSRHGMACIFLVVARSITPRRRRHAQSVNA
ncbi:MAG: hypothetical protein O2782_17580 [bacterium]|nr:hypothetical protein [bacterium]